MFHNVVIVLGVFGVLFSVFIGIFFGIDWKIIGLFVTISLGLPTLILKFDNQKSKDSKNNPTENNNFKITKPIVKPILPSKKITDIDISKDLLNKIHSKIQNQVIMEYSDVKLSSFTISVEPYIKIVDNVLIFFRFYSKISNKNIEFCYSVKSCEIKQINKPKIVRMDFLKRVFSSKLPWNESTNWNKFLDVAYSMIPELTPHEKSTYRLTASKKESGKTRWYVIFEDGFNGQDHKIAWNGKNINSENIVKEY